MNVAEIRAIPAAEPSDEQLLTEVRAGRIQGFERLMRRHNQRLFRTVRSIVLSDADAEDVVQQAYINAYEHLDQFNGEAKFSTWLTRIAVHEALARTRRQRRHHEVVEMGNGAWTQAGRPETTPEHQAARRELRALLEAAIDRLPDTRRTVFVMRDVEGLSGLETAECLGLSEVAVRVQLHRARSQLRQLLFDEAGAATAQAYAFAGDRCDRIVQRVLSRIAAGASRAD